MPRYEVERVEIELLESIVHDYKLTVYSPGKEPSVDWFKDIDVLCDKLVYLFVIYQPTDDDFEMALTEGPLILNVKIGYIGFNEGDEDSTKLEQLVFDVDVERVDDFLTYKDRVVRRDTKPIVLLKP